MQPAVLFLFAHQDDEFGTFRRILLARQAGARVCCAYLTSGVPPGASAATRNEESVRVLGQLGVSEADIHFAGEALAIPDGQLVRHLDAAIDWLASWMAQSGAVESIYLPAWEGGHPDHDALHAAGLIAADAAMSSARLRQFPLYNGYRCRGPLFRVLQTLPANGPTEEAPIPWSQRLQFVRYCLSYPSQAKSWVGLLPFTLMHYVLHGAESVQGVSLERLRERPHAGPLYYERRRFCTWPQLQQAVSACIARRPRVNTT